MSRAKRVRIVWLAGLVLALIPSLAWGAEADDWFAQAIHADDVGNADLAFTLYRRAAEAGHAQAEFNVAAMFDTGRGVSRDIGRAATWYARAAVRGNARAAYNLGQLYEAGQGVPCNTALAGAWYAASGLPAARTRRTGLAPSPTTGELTAPEPVFPTARAVPQPNGTELVWTAQAQPEPVTFFVELRALGGAASREIFSAFVSTSGTLTIPLGSGDFAWRFSTVARKSARYVASPWIAFTVAAT